MIAYIYDFLKDVGIFTIVMFIIVKVVLSICAYGAYKNKDEK